MNELSLFNFKGSDIRALEIDGNPYFIGKDIAEILGYKDTSDALKKHVDSEDKLTRRFADSGQNRLMYAINESGLYSLIISSKLPAAKEFKRWVTSEVLPSIRKHGAYMTPDTIEKMINSPDLLIGLATKLKKEQEDRMAAENKVIELTPKASYYDSILANKSLMTITVIAKDYGMSGQEMNKMLHKYGVQFKQGGIWLLYSKYQKNGWTHSNTRIIKIGRNEERAVVDTKWTQKGRLGLYKLLKEKGILPMIEKTSLVGIG